MNERQPDQGIFHVYANKVGSFAGAVVIEHNVEIARNVFLSGTPLNRVYPALAVFPVTLFGKIGCLPCPRLKAQTELD
ncbi:hypothetical protein [Pseudomonas sp. CMR5c]|uniref:hypothetical protein n=1 Tax=Pseudomonas sp. CMR5c TaxID=658630 RepID=UPI000F585A7D|nr:hypothetical protein [Pseudomonas sp. CMR5c]